MEKDFLLYLLYSTLIGIRERSVENGDEITVQLCNLIHTIPLQFRTDEDIKRAYQKLCDNVELKGMQEWLETRKEEYYSSYYYSQQNK